MPTYCTISILMQYTSRSHTLDISTIKRNESRLVNTTFPSTIGHTDHLHTTNLRDWKRLQNQACLDKNWKQTHLVTVIRGKNKQKNTTTEPCKSFLNNPKCYCSFVCTNISPQLMPWGDQKCYLQLVLWRPLQPHVHDIIYYQSQTNVTQSQVTVLIHW